jgi:uncharacterized membrane protein YeaQ/YmgE (transglycosylase-associated protein family)
LITFFLIICLTGLLVGGLARLALPGRDPMSLWQTMAIGIAGGFLAGLVGLVIGRGLGFPIAVLFATGGVYLVRRSRGQGIGRTPSRRQVR